MVEKEKEKDVSATQQNTSSNNLSANTITQDGLKNQVYLDGGKTKKKKYSKENKKCLSYASTVYSLALKFYEEQLPYGYQHTYNIIASIDPKKYQILLMVHYKDTYADKGHFWEPAYEKPHFHVIIRCVNRKDRIKVGSMLKKLGIEYRKDLDAELWKNHGATTVGNFSSYATYLMHQTDAAINEGKELYDISEFVSNLTIDEIQQICDGYIQVSTDTKKVTSKELAELDQTAFKLGTELKNFDEWYNTLPFTIRSNAKMKTIRESYGRGVNAKIAEKSEVLRLCVYIQGDPNTGKTFGSKSALKEKRIHTVEGGGSGKFDDLRADHQAIIISDDVCPNLLNMTDNYICRAYKRQSNNPAWTGNYFIVTSNLSFEDWLASCKININSKHFEAMKSRFFVCKILQKEDGTNYLALKNPSTRGSYNEQKKRADMFMDFQRKFNDIMVDYRPSEIEIDYDSMIDDTFKIKEEVKQPIAEKEEIPSVMVGYYLDKNGNPQLGNPYTILRE